MTVQPTLNASPVADPLAGFGDRAYVLESLKILHISVPKNACTSMRWLIAELAGEDPDSFRPGLTPLLSTEDAIHRRGAFQRTPRLRQVDRELRRTISPANGWFVFAIVRDQRSRLFSAWQNKFLMRSPAYAKWRDAEWYPQLPETPEDIAFDFARFVDLLRTEPDHPLRRDGHFSDQTRLVRANVVPYSRVYDVSEISTLLADLTEHLRAQGVERDLKLRRTNDTPLRANDRALAEPVRSQIEQMYAVDFDNFGHMWDYARIEGVGDWTPEAVQELRARILLHERIGELLDRARDEWGRAQRAEAQLDRANQRVAELTQRAKRAEQRLERANHRVASLEGARSTRIGLAARRLRGRVRRLARRG